MFVNLRPQEWSGKSEVCCLWKRGQEFFKISLSEVLAPDPVTQETALHRSTFCDDYYKCYTVYYKQYSVSKYLTSWGKVLLVKLAVPQLVKKFPIFYCTWSLITVFTRAHHCALFWVRWIQFTSS